MPIYNRRAPEKGLTRRSLIQWASPKEDFSMNQRYTGLGVAKALTGFLQYKSAEGLAPVTVSGYERDLKLWIEYQGHWDIRQIRSQNIVAFLNYLRTEYVPRRIAGD